MRDQRRARAFVEAYLRADVLDCEDPAAAEKTLFELYRWPTPATRVREPGTAPNWMSGEPYAPGEVFYDPLSGSFRVSRLGLQHVEGRPPDEHRIPLGRLHGLVHHDQRQPAER